MILFSHENLVDLVTLDDWFLWVLGLAMAGFQFHPMLDVFSTGKDVRLTGV